LNYNQAYVICSVHNSGKNERYKISLPALYALLINTAKKSLLTEQEIYSIHAKMSYEQILEGVHISDKLRDFNNQNYIRAKL
jgi:hypothetical protein